MAAMVKKLYGFQSFRTCEICSNNSSGQRILKEMNTFFPKKIWSLCFDVGTAKTDCRGATALSKPDETSVKSVSVFESATTSSFPKKDEKKARELAATSTDDFTRHFYFPPEVADVNRQNL